MLALACAKPRFIYEVDGAFRSEAHRTISQDPRRDRIVIREGMRPLNPELHLRAVLTELETRRYQLAPAEEADLWVALYVLVSGQSDGSRSSSGHHEGSGEGHRGGRGGGGKGGSPESDPQGKASATVTVIVQLEDRKTGRPVWHGEANIYPKDTDTSGRPLGIEEAVHQLMQPLPTLP
jgi:hypothetical protein